MWSEHTCTQEVKNLKNWFLKVIETSSCHQGLHLMINTCNRNIGHVHSHMRKMCVFSVLPLVVRGSRRSSGENRVLTAAHCLKVARSLKLSPASTFLLIPNTTLTNEPKHQLAQSNRFWPTGRGPSEGPGKSEGASHDRKTKQGTQVCFQTLDSSVIFDF